MWLVHRRMKLDKVKRFYSFWLRTLSDTWRLLQLTATCSSYLDFFYCRMKRRENWNTFSVFKALLIEMIKIINKNKTFKNLYHCSVKFHRQFSKVAADCKSFCFDTSVCIWSRFKCAVASDWPAVQLYHVSRPMIAGIGSRPGPW